MRKVFLSVSYLFSQFLRAGILCWEKVKFEAVGRVFVTFLRHSILALKNWEKSTKHMEKTLPVVFLTTFRRMKLTNIKKTVQFHFWHSSIVREADGSINFQEFQREFRQSFSSNVWFISYSKCSNCVEYRNSHRTLDVYLLFCYSAWAN